MSVCARWLSRLYSVLACALLAIGATAQGSLEWARFGQAGYFDLPTPPAGVYWTKVCSNFYGHIVALGNDGLVRSVGIPYNSQYYAQAPALPTGVTYVDIAVGMNTCYALRSDGIVSLWGGSFPQNYLGGFPSAPAGRQFVQLSPSKYHFAALLDNGTIWITGINNSWGLLNVPALPPGMTYTEVTTGEKHTLALRSDGQIIAWGLNTYGQLNVPALPAGQIYTSVTATGTGGCATTSAGTIVIWGSMTNLPGPGLPPTGEAWIKVWAGVVGSTCYALSSAGTVRPFGYLDGPNGQAGVMGVLPNIDARRRWIYMNGVLTIAAASIKDCDRDGLDDAVQIASGQRPDCDMNGWPDACDITSGAADANGDGVPDLCAVDCNQNGTFDVLEIGAGTAVDCDHDARIDTCQIVAGAPDCDNNGALDSCIMAANDCNANNVLDRCDVAAGATDCNGDLVPDSCQITGADCNLNGRLDTCDLAAGGLDCNADLVLDECQLAGADCDGDGRLDACQPGGLADCNTNGVRDWCDVVAGMVDCDRNRVPDVCQLAPASDCNQNQRLDVCDIAAGLLDLNTDGVPDGCQSDCNGNGSPDATDIATGLASDCDRNGRPDSCDLLVAGADVNGDGQLDRCVGGVIVVAPVGGDYADVQTALNAIGDGDTILVRPGTYPGFAVANRDVRIVGEVGRLAVIQGAVRVRNLSAGKTVVLDGLRATGVVSTLAAERHGLYISNCAGAVRVQDCEFRSQTTQVGMCDAIPAIGILSSTDVVLSGVDAITPVSGILAATPLYAAAGMRTESSRVAAFGCRFTGGAGSRYGCYTGCTDIPGWEFGCANYKTNCDGNYGGPAVDALGGSLHLDGCTLTGGVGGDYTACAGICGSCVYGGDGGDCLRLRNGVSAKALGCVYQPGASSGTDDSSVGWQYRTLDTASFTPVSGQARSMLLTSPLREGATTLLQCRGEPGDFWTVAVTRGTTYLESPLFASVQVCSHPGLPRYRILGSMPQSGRLDATLVLPFVPTEGQTVCVQPYVRAVGGQMRQGTPVQLTILDQGY